MTEQVARLAVTESCLEFYREGGKTLIVVDEAHHLAVDVLEELRLLSNLEGKDGKAVQVLLVALPVIAADPRQAGAGGAPAATHGAGPDLDRSTPDESADYLRHQVDGSRRQSGQTLRRGRARHPDARRPGHSARS